MLGRQARWDIDVCPSSSAEDTEPCTEYYPAEESDEFVSVLCDTEQHKSVLMVKDHTALSGRWVSAYCL
jgi:hypothetical protein